MRNLIIILCIVSQASVLAYMIFGREQVIATGHKVTIATAPIDPRDPFRGDYVRLRYPMNSFSSAPTRWTPESYEPRKGDKIYAVLTQRSSGLHTVNYFTNQQPETKVSDTSIYIRGRVQSNHLLGGRNSVNAKFGVEQLFVQQGTGIDIENKRGIRGGMQTSMEAEISIGKTGTAILTDYDWSPLGIGLELTENFSLFTNDPPDSTAVDQEAVNPQIDANPRQAPVVVQIQNLSDKAITINNPGDNCGFQLEPAQRDSSKFTVADNSCTSNSEMALYTLEPQQLLTINVDLKDPRWHVALKDNKDLPAGDLRAFTEYSELFRIVYRTTQSDDVQSLSSGLWQGDLISQAFNQRGWID